MNKALTLTLLMLALFALAVMPVNAQTTTIYTVQADPTRPNCAATAPDPNFLNWSCFMTIGTGVVEEADLESAYQSDWPDSTFYRWQANGQQIASYGGGQCEMNSADCVTGTVDLTNQFLHFDFVNATSTGHIDVGYKVIPKSCYQQQPPCGRWGCKLICTGPFVQLTTGTATITE